MASETTERNVLLSYWTDLGASPWQPAVWETHKDEDAKRQGNLHSQITNQPPPPLYVDSKKNSKEWDA